MDEKCITAAFECVEYILISEEEDFFDQAKYNDWDKENWRDSNHVYAFACIALGTEPDFE
jgi:hypothetical protein